MSNLCSYAQVKQKIQDEYQRSLEAGKVTPASSPIGSLNFIFLIGWLLVCSSLSDIIFRRSRVPVFTVIVSISVWNLLYVRSVGVIGSIGVGLNSALCAIIATNFVLIHDPRSFKRLVLRPPGRAIAANERAYLIENIDADSGKDSKYVLAWQSMPQTLWARLVWVLDLITTFRHVHWSWGSTEPSSPISKQQWLISVRSNRSNSIMRNGTRFLMDYMLLDLIKCIMIADPYFIGCATSKKQLDSTPHITSPFGLYSYRTLLGTAGVCIAIDLIFSFTVLLQVDLLGQNVLGLNASQAAFPPLWGNHKAISQRGLRGFWGETWHQIFRMHFVSVGDAMARVLLPQSYSASYKNSNREKMPDNYSGHSTTRLVVRIMVAFFLSGMVHMCASYTLLGSTTPWKPLIFFSIQPLGMALQACFSRPLTRCSAFGLSARSETVIRQLSNHIFTIIWLWTCSGMFLDDVTRGGIWMFEPIPVSLIRGFGFSKADQRFWCW